MDQWLPKERAPTGRPFVLVVMGNPPTDGEYWNIGRCGLIFSARNEKGSSNGASFRFGGDGWN